jgi:diguanylate cyclase (GGDEF)-like protein
MRGVRLPCGVVVGLMAGWAAAEPCDPDAVVRIAQGTARAGLDRPLVLEDAAHALALADVLAPPAAAAFAARPALQGPDFVSRSRFFVRFCADFRGELPQRFFLHIPFPSFDRLCVHWPTPGGYETLCAGLRYPRASRPVAHEGFVFPVPEGVDLARPVYLEAESRTPWSLQGELVRADAFVSADHERQFLGGVFNGVLLLAAIYSLVFFSGMKDRAALYYALHLTLLGLAILGFEGKGHELLWSGLGPASAHLPTVLLGLSFVFGVAYGREFLQTRRRLPAFDRGLLAAGLVALAVVPTSLASIDAAERLGALAGIAFVVAVGAAGLALVRRGDRPARFLLLALSPPLLVGLVVIGVRVLGLAVLPRDLGVTATKLGLVIGAATMSLALNQRLRELRGQRDRARAEAAAQQHLALRRAYFDELTELPNRSRFVAEGTPLLGGTLNASGALAVIVVNLVRLRDVNHALGQAAGDAVLVEVGRRLRAVFGRAALVARLGGDEFAAAFRVDPEPARGKDAAERVAQDVLAAVSVPFLVEGRSLRLSATLGVALAPADGQTLTDLLRGCEIAIEWTRDGGHEEIAFYAARERREPGAELVLRNELWRAIESDELEVFYQPQHELLSGGLAGTEALVRWRHPRLGLLAPGSFVPLAEQSDLVSRLGEKVLRTVCRDQLRWAALGHAPPRVSVNASARDFQREGFHEQVTALLGEEGLEPSRVELELTESRLVANLEATSRCMSGLRRRGVRVCLDDFGTGYSSLSQIRDLPIQALKVDRSFVVALGESAEADAILGTLVRLAEELRLDLTAEGVETEGQRERLRSFGCRYAQGYLFAAAMPRDAMTAYLAARNGRPGPEASV